MPIEIDAAKTCSCRWIGTIPIQKPLNRKARRSRDSYRRRIWQEQKKALRNGAELWLPRTQLSKKPRNSCTHAVWEEKKRKEIQSYETNCFI